MIDIYHKQLNILLKNNSDKIQESKKMILINNTGKDNNLF